MSLDDIWRGDVMPLSGIDVSIGRNNFDPPAPVVPVFDAHHRSMVIHTVDTSSEPNAEGNSGVISYHSLLRRLGLIPSNSGVQTIVPGDVIDVYRDAANSSIGNGTFTAVAYNTTRTNTNPKLYELKSVSGIVQVHASGIYDIQYRASAENSSSSVRITKRFWIQKLSPRNNETGFVEIPGTRGYVYLHNAIPGDSTAIARCIIPLQAEDMIMVVVNASGGAVSLIGLTIVSSGCGLTIERLE